MAQPDLAAGLLLQERQESNVPDHDYPQPLRVAVPHQEDILHGQVRHKYRYLLSRSVNCPMQTDLAALLLHEVRLLPARRADLPPQHGEL